MSILGAFMVPHPPLIIPEIGKGEENKISATIDSYRQVAKKIAKLKPETIIVASPHATIYSDYFHISPGKMAKGDMSRFGAEDVFFGVDYDNDFVVELFKEAAANGFPAGTFGENDPSLDHGTLIPLYFISQEYSDFNLVRIGLSGLDYAEHYRLGAMIKSISETMNRRVVFIASGDMSHKLIENGPYGFNEMGPVYDNSVIEIMKAAEFDKLISLNTTMCESAGECGQRSFCIMAGTLDRTDVKADVLSYEGPFGVGYGVASFIPLNGNDDRCFYDKWLEEHRRELAERQAKEDEYVALARRSLNEFINNDKIITADDSISSELTNNRAGVFVSLHLNGSLRGCIGTINPVQKNIAEEIIGNAIAAGVRDPRFMPVTMRELEELEISVDVLSEAEPIDDKSLLDVKKYGVIVRQGDKQGLLLPNLDGVDTVDKQLEIALSKACIDTASKDYSMLRFEVVRHY